MTDVIDRETETNSAQPGISDARLKELVEQARAEGLQLTGRWWIAVEADQASHGVRARRRDGRPPRIHKSDPAGRGSGNSRNGRRTKNVLTEAGPVELEVPRDWDSSFEPKIVAKRQRDCQVWMTW